MRTHSEIEEFFAVEKPEEVFWAAAKVGGIGVNSESPTELLYEKMNYHRQENRAEIWTIIGGAGRVILNGDNYFYEIGDVIRREITPKNYF